MISVEQNDCAPTVPQELTVTKDRNGSDDGRMRPPRTNSTEGPIDAFDQRNGCNRVETRGTER
jgi:hypothetical protein